jgi:NAD(P)-dependent dehydrogenase (short-subunit alcohol dehydrogenase family)
MRIPQELQQSRSVIVTGAAQGLGLAIARRFAAGGSRVILVDRDPTVLPLVGDDILPADRCFPLVQELQDPDAARQVFSHAIDKLGIVDTVINNAAWSLYKPFLETTLEDFDRAVAVNQRAPYFLTQEFFRYVSNSLPKVKDPTVVNIASVNALAGNANLIAYAGTKGALAAMTRAMAVEMAPLGIRVASISPGALDTPHTRKLVEEGIFEGHNQFEKFLIKRPTACEDIAELVLFLCTPACATVTGANWVIDGGYLAQ